MAPRKTEPKSSIRTIPLDISRGMYSGGSAAAIPRGCARKIQNCLLLDGVWQYRPPFTYDGIPGARSLMLWDDQDTETTRLVVIDVNGGVHYKDAAGEGYTNPLTLPSYARVLQYANLRGLLFAAVDDGAGNPKIVRVLDGTNADLAQSFGPPDSGIEPTCITSFIGRVFVAGGRIRVTNLFATGNPAAWNPTNALITNIGSGPTLYRIMPTTSAGFVESPPISASNGTNDGLTARVELRNNSATYAVPMKLEMLVRSPWNGTWAYGLQEVHTPTVENGFRYRVIVAGTSAAAEPVWPTSDTVVDGTVTWLCDGPQIFAAQDFSVIPKQEPAVWIGTQISGRFDGSSRVIVKLTFDGPTELVPIDFAYEDGVPDGSARKESHGAQLTGTLYSQPYFNQDTSGGTALVPMLDRALWSEPFAPQVVAPDNSYNVIDVAGGITAQLVHDDLMMAKRRAIFVYGVTGDAGIPILIKRTIRSGIIGGRAYDIGPDGELYYIGETDCYVWPADGDPKTFLTDAMRSEVMNKGAATWVELQAAPCNMPLLAVDIARRRVLLYAQKGIIHVYDINNKAWSTIDAGGNEIADMIYNPNTGNVYVAFGTAPAGTPGLARLDDSETNTEDQISDSGTIPIVAQIMTRPIEVTPREFLTVHQARVSNAITASQSGQTTKALVSLDQGVTFTREVAGRVPTGGGSFEPTTFEIFQTGPSVTLMFEHTGKGGPENWNVSGIEVDVQSNGKFTERSLTVASSSL
jgi:hypothetical protein